MDTIPPSIPATDWISDPAAALASTVSDLAGAAHAHPILGWVLLAYLGVLYAGKKIDLPAPYGTALHIVSNLLWMLTASKVQNQSDVAALTHSKSLGILTDTMKELGGNASVQELEDHVIAKIAEPYRTEIIKMLQDSGMRAAGVPVVVTGPPAPVTDAPAPKV